MYLAIDFKPRSPRDDTPHYHFCIAAMASLSSSWEALQSAVFDAYCRLVSLAGLDGQRAGTGLMVVLCSLVTVVISWKFLRRCRRLLKLRRMSRTVPSIR